MAKIWVADTEPNERFTLYTRGNVGEVFPHVMTALTGTLIGDAVRQGQTEFLVEMGVLRPHEVTGPSVGTGVFGGYLYMSGSAMRLFGVRMPGMSPARRRRAGDGRGHRPPAVPASQGRPQPARVTGAEPIRPAADAHARPGCARHSPQPRRRTWLASMPDLRTASDRASCSTGSPRSHRAKQRA